MSRNRVPPVHDQDPIEEVRAAGRKIVSDEEIDAADIDRYFEANERWFVYRTRKPSDETGAKKSN